MKNQLRVLVCGGRDYNDWKTLSHVLSSIDNSYESPEAIGPISCIISGGAAGADSMAAKWARENQIPLEEFEASWYLHGSRAGFVRNALMLDEGLPDLVVAFPGGSGTAHMVKIAKKANCEVIDVTEPYSWPGPGV
jgi:hypothetical protein